MADLSRFQMKITDVKLGWIANKSLPKPQKKFRGQPPPSECEKWQITLLESINSSKVQKQHVYINTLCGNIFIPLVSKSSSIMIWFGYASYGIWAPKF